MCKSRMFTHRPPQRMHRLRVTELPGVKLPASPSPPEPSITHSCESLRARKTPLPENHDNTQMSVKYKVLMKKSCPDPNSAATDASTVHTSPYPQLADDRRGTRPALHIPLLVSTTSAGNVHKRVQSRVDLRDPSTTFTLEIPPKAPRTVAEHVSTVTPGIAREEYPTSGCEVHLHV